MASKATLLFCFVIFYLIGVRSVVINLPPQYSAVGEPATFRCLAGYKISYWQVTKENSPPEIVAVETPTIGRPWITSISTISEDLRMYQLEVTVVEDDMFGASFCCTGTDRMACSVLLETEQQESCVTNNGLDGPANQCVPLGQKAFFTCTISDGHVHWLSQTPEQIGYQLITQDDVVLTGNNIYSIHIAEINQTHRSVILEVNKVQEDLMGVQFSCFHNETFSCASLISTELNKTNLEGWIMIQEDTGVITANAAGYTCRPGLTLFLYIDKNLVATRSPADCEVEHELTLVFDYSFDLHQLGDCVNVDLNYTHPLNVEEVHLADLCHIVKGHQPGCERRAELQGPADQCVPLGTSAEFTCIVGEGKFQWQYQEPGYAKPSLLAYNTEVILTKRPTYTAGVQLLNSTHRMSTLVINEVTKELVSSKYYCVYDTISSCASLYQSELEVHDVLSDITVSESRGVIIGRIWDLYAVPAVTIHIYINSEMVAESTPDDCTPQNGTIIVHRYPFYKHVSGDVLRIEMTYGHPLKSDEVSLYSMWYIVTRAGSRSTKSCPKREEFSGPTDACAAPGDEILFRCEETAEDAFWIYQAGDSDPYLSLAEPLSQTTDAATAVLNFSIISGSDVGLTNSSNITSLRAAGVTAEMNMSKVFCVNNGVASCGQIFISELSADNITANITLVDGYINIFVSQFFAQPAIHLYLSVNHELVMEDDQGCVQQSYIFISHNYTFDSAGFVLIDLTYTHPNVPDEIFLTSQNLTVEFVVPMSVSIDETTFINTVITCIVMFCMGMEALIYGLCRLLAKPEQTKFPPHRNMQRSNTWSTTRSTTSMSSIYTKVGNGMSRNGTVSAPGSVSGSPKHKHGKLSKGDIRVVPGTLRKQPKQQSQPKSQPRPQTQPCTKV